MTVMGTSRESYLLIKFFRLMNELFRSNQRKYTDLRENSKGKNHGIRERVPV